MAKTVDEIVLKTSVEGQQTLDQLNSKLASIDESSKKTAQAMNQVQGGVRNVAYQIQDLAVQLSMGTNAFMALGQQLPQLLSGFGTIGVVIGAVAAVAIPLLQAGLKAVGIDMRNLKEMTDDLGKSTDAYINAQRQNLPTLEGMRVRYGSLTEEAKRFYELQERLTASKTQRDAIDAIKELRDEYGKLGKDAENVKPFRNMADTGAMGSASEDFYKWFQRFRKGITEEQGQAIADMLKEIDAASPEKTVNAINNVLNYLSAAGPEAENFKQSFEKSVEPLMKINQELLKQKENIRAAADAASQLQTDLTTFQNQFSPDINKARRNFDQVTAINTESKMKIAEFNRQMDEKEKQGSISADKLAAERAAGLLRIQQDTADKVKDFAKGQSEAYQAIVLTNDGKIRQLDLESKILDIQDKGRLALSYNVQYEEAIANNAKNYADTVAGLGEQLRKNQITQGDYTKAVQQAADIQKRADENAEQARQKRIRDLELQNTIQRTNIEFGLKSQTVALENNLELEKRSTEFSSLEIEYIKQRFEITQRQSAAIEAINENVALGQEEQQRRIDLINGLYNDQRKILEDILKYRQAEQKDFGKGALQRIKEISESMSNFKVAGMAVDAVWNNLSSGIDKFVETGKFKFSDFARSVIMDLEKIILKASLMNFIKAGAGAMGFSIPGLAVGGPVSSGSPYLVGEQGPELFVPSTAGNIVPNGKLGGAIGGNTYITNHISAVDAKSVAQLFAENRMSLLGTVEQARRELPMRTR